MRGSIFFSIVAACGTWPFLQPHPWRKGSGDDIAAYATWETVFPHRDLQGVLGAAVQSSSGEDMGHIVQVLVDQAGGVRAAVIDFGEFLGVGSRKVVVDWGALHFAPENQPQQIMLDLTGDWGRKAAQSTAPGSRSWCWVQPRRRARNSRRHAPSIVLCRPLDLERPTCTEASVTELAVPHARGRCPRPASARHRAPAFAGSTGSSSSSPTCRPGFGPFVTVYLTSAAWTQIDIGSSLSVGGLVALLGQMPGGAIVDAVRPSGSLPRSA